MVSSLFIGTSFTLKKKSLMRAAVGTRAAILVTQLGALSIIVSAVLTHFILRERLQQLGVVGCILCIVGSVALDTFNAAIVSPIYSVMFTTLTIIASTIMFKDWTGQDVVVSYLISVDLSQFFRE
uniref:Probable magnesium transporter n=1 Tax=Solanum lycopersicum TaxID=4081 RepID=A0A3Q7FEQ3_SOLLC